MKETFECPEWLKRGVMYQIFPDRFSRNASVPLPKQSKDWVFRQDWGGEPEKGPDETGEVRCRDFFGGNLKGIQDRLPYLEELGVTVIYLNPIFEAYSNHRYDTADYEQIDPLLGSEEDFCSLCAEAGKRGIRIILDGVFNHTGSDSRYFNKEGRYPDLGAYQSKASPYYSWYRFSDYPREYESWWGIKTLPQVDENCESYLDYMVRNHDSIVRRWLRLGASGWRLDVVDELPDQFLEELRLAVKGEKPDAAVIGEVWEDAATKVSYGQQRHYLDGTQLDSVMNYPLKDAILRYVAGKGPYGESIPGLGDGALLVQTVNQLKEHYPKTVFNGLMNLLGTHDTPRIYTLLSENGKETEQGRQRLFLAMLPWALLPGIPCIYYGDELGMQGGRDPENRRCFCPEQGQREIFLHYKKLMAFRNRITRLEQMELKRAEADGGFCLFVRESGGEQLIFALNMEEAPRLLPLEGKTISDFFISGNVRFSGLDAFEIGSGSGVAAVLKKQGGSVEAEAEQ